MDILKELDLRNIHRLELCEELLKEAKRCGDVERMRDVLRGHIMALTIMTQDRDAKP